MPVRRLLAAAVLLFASVADAHPALGTVASVTVTGTDAPRTVEVVVTLDALAYALNDTSTRVTDPQMYALLDGPRDELADALRDARERFRSGFAVLADGEPLPLTLIESPSLESVDRWSADTPAHRLPLKADYIAHATLPDRCATISVRAPAVLDRVLLAVSIPDQETAYLPLEPGERSPEFTLPASPSAAGTHDRHAAQTPGVFDTAWRYVRLGYEHIIPGGTDHALFILGLFLLNTRLRDVAWQTTAFTIAHTCTLTLATLGVVNLPPSIVEPTIAATIAVVAIKNLFQTNVTHWRTAAAFLFGLVHGLGFASALRSFGMPNAQLATGLAAFSVGVELGHLSVLLAAFATIGWWRRKDWYRRRIAVPLSAGVAAIALFWFASRTGLL